MTRQPCIGIDFGGVIIPSSVQDGVAGDAFLDAKLKDAVQMPPTPGCLDGLRNLVSTFSGNVWIISKACAQTEQRTWGWIQHHEFTKYTGVEPSRIRACRERATKVDICMELGVTHYLDDQVVILESLRDVVEHRFLFCADERVTVPGGIVRVGDWAQAVESIRQSLP